MSDASVPFHVSPGNGDSGGNFSEYKARWFMPGRDTPLSADDADPVRSTWHSFDVGRAHITGLSSEAMGFYQGDLGGRFGRMMRWLEADLAAANTPAARSRRPWIIVHLHRPAYSSVQSEALGPSHSEYVVENKEAAATFNQGWVFPL